jgi:hypothetical protein
MRSFVVSALVSMGFVSSALAQSPCSPGLDLTVSPAAPMLGEVITVTVTNNTGVLLWHTLGAPIGGAFAGGCGGTWIWSPWIIDLPTPLAPGTSASVVWDQTDSIFGEQVPPGRYGFTSLLSDDQQQAYSCCIEVTIHGPCGTPPTAYGTASVGAGGFAPSLSAVNGPAYFGNDAFALAVAGVRGGAVGGLVVGAGFRARRDALGFVPDRRELAVLRRAVHRERGDRRSRSRRRRAPRHRSPMIPR